MEDALRAAVEQPRHTIRALLFDFDGLLVDTESPAYEAWAGVYREHGHELPLDRWSAAVGTIDGFSPFDDLEGLLGQPLDRGAVDARRRAAEFAQTDRAELRAGIADYLEEAARLGLARAIVSSSGDDWIQRHLERLGLLEGWGCIVVANGDANRAKPRPTLYLEALEHLRVGAAEAIAFEDSPNGIAAAKAAGIYCVAVPNPITNSLDLARADRVVASLGELPLPLLLAQVEQEEGSAR